MARWLTVFEMALAATAFREATQAKSKYVLPQSIEVDYPKAIGVGEWSEMIGLTSLWRTIHDSGLGMVQAVVPKFRGSTLAESISIQTRAGIADFDRRIAIEDPADD